MILVTLVSLCHIDTLFLCSRSCLTPPQWHHFLLPATERGRYSKQGLQEDQDPGTSDRSLPRLCQRKQEHPCKFMLVHWCFTAHLKLLCGRRRGSSDRWSIIPPRVVCETRGFLCAVQLFSVVDVWNPEKAHLLLCLSGKTTFKAHARLYCAKMHTCKFTCFAWCNRLTHVSLCVLATV